MDVVQLDDKGIPLFAKPMLAVRKTDIHKSLLSQGIKWREDGSNLTNKYKRNRIRNELMPLLSDIAGGEDVLQVKQIPFKISQKLYCILTEVFSLNH